MFGYDPTIITFTIYIIGMLLIGVLAYRYTSNLSDYILGGRSLGGFVTGMSAGASDMSGWLLMGLPGAVYAAGLVEAWIAIGLTIGAYLNWYFVAGRLRVFTESHDNALTLPEYFQARFSSKQGNNNHKMLKIVAASIILFFFTIYCSSGVVAGARLFENLFGTPYQTALWYGALATIIYTFIGGFLAVSWTDTVQATLMVLALIITPVMVLFAIGGIDDFSQVLAAASNDLGKNFTDMWTGTSLIGLFSLSAWGLGYFGQPHILARFMAAENVRSLTSARRIGISWMIFCLLGAVGVGFFGIAYFYAHPDLATAVNNNREQIFIELARHLFNPWIAGVLLSAILAAVMSTLSCQLLISSSAITEDFYRGFIRPKASDKELVWLGRLMVLAIAVIAIAIAQNPESQVLKLVEHAWAGFGSSFGPLVLFSLFWQRTNANGAMAGMMTGALVVSFWNRVIPDSGIYEMIPGFILSSLAIVLVSLLTKQPQSDILENYQNADRQYKANL
ncbi:sodium/proline symporter PutP [Testudinibacter sp. TR-2022]|uniref:sodium/proline symporter PutP n=1 Tax=Testudinibacter sp. TR-2022 TaxID=2585029 RepID=UPI00111997EC|nr:sodium/proline symporter PutP [Testudinibacter sp. TR-2022]TNH06424.1 sodium/proline symporter PutP [Pasteurellaceae bacterium Phil11]TNH22952.1 sodium/proline symporter PutP [Testudinibacter sp. TR-2022]TNH27684.1 sodium/proline symporter PutP [Testudinibacter sp. TR-2022]